MKLHLRNLLVFFLLLFAMACNNTMPTPKPTAYPRIEFPAKKYVAYKNECPYDFKIPTYANVSKDTSDKLANCWINVNFKDFNAKLHLSYFHIDSMGQFYKMLKDAHEFAYHHTVKAEDISETRIDFPNRVDGLKYVISGNTASSVQFYVTDSSKHFLRGALYFASHPNKDSLDPIIRFLQPDIDTFLASIRWK
jgi:gliding motility-associated lipoprotein GldD